MNTDKSQKKNHRLGVAFSGGGARGFAHLGAIKALEEAGMKPDILSGVSAGSVVAVFYASGLSPEKIMSLFSNRKFRDFCEFSLSLSRKNGFFSLDRFKDFVREVIAPYKNLEDLPISTYLGVTDFNAGTAAEFHTGEIAERVAASCSIPICFSPTVIDGVAYVDGGVVRNMPAWIIRDKCEYLIGVNCSPVVRYNTMNSIADVAMRTYNLMAKANQVEDLAMCDIAVEIPEIAHYKVFNLKEINKVFISGYASMRRAIKMSPWIIEEVQNRKNTTHN